MLMPTVIGAIGAVWNLTDKARDHEILAHRFNRIARMIDVENASAESVEAWRREILHVYDDESGIYHALNAECYNAATRALSFQPKQLLQVSLLHHFLRNWIRFSEQAFPARAPVSNQPTTGPQLQP